MKLLITGGFGQLGTELQRQLNTGGSALGSLPEALTDAEILSPPKTLLNICDREAVMKYVTAQCPDVVIHCAAMSDVEGCEDDSHQCMLVNGTAVSHIALACEAVDAKLVYISSDYVFSGEKNAPYLTGDTCSPLSEYGKSKYLGELKAVEHCSQTFIVRTSWLYGLNGKNFVKTIINKASAVNELKVVSDQCGNPTNAEDLAHHILRLITTDNYGIYHCTGKGICSWYEFAKEIVSLIGSSCKVLPCTSSEYPQKAKRPRYSALDNSMMQAVTGCEMRHWKDALNDYIRQLEEIK